jgi:hypothetical protein
VRLLDPYGRPTGEGAARPVVLDGKGSPWSRQPQERAAEDPEASQDPGDDQGQQEVSQEQEDGEALQKKIDPTDHAISELLSLRPGITNEEIGELVNLTESAVSRRRHRPVFLRYMIWLRKPAVEIIRSAQKKAAQRLSEALDAMYASGRPDHWIRIAAVRIITDMTIGRSGALASDAQISDIPGIPADEVPELAHSLVDAYRKHNVKMIKRLPPDKKAEPDL